MAYLKLNIESWEAYNNGYLLGKWHNVTDLDQSELGELCAKITKEQTQQLNKLLNWNLSNCEELFCPDIDTDLPIEYSECDIFKMFNQFQELKELLENESEETVKLAQAIKESEGLESIADSLERAQSAIVLDSTHKEGQHYDLGYYYMESTGGLNDYPQHITNYFNYESFGRDLVLGGDYDLYTIDGNGYAVPAHY